MAKTKNRGNGEGTVYKVRDNYYRGQVTIGRDDEGKLIRKNVYGKTKKEVKDKIIALQSQKQSGFVVTNESTTVEELLLSLIEEDRALNLINENTYIRKLETLKRIQAHSISKVAIKQVTEAQIKDFLSSITHYSNSVITKEYQLLQRCFRTAIQKDVIYKNPMEFVRVPKSQNATKKVRAFTIEEQQKFLAILNDPSNSIKYKEQMLIMIYSGMRMGEINALSVNDVNIEDKTININRTMTKGLQEEAKIGTKTKTYSSKRVIPMNAKVQSIISKCNDSSNDKKLIFYNYASNKPISTNNVSCEFRRVLDKYDIVDKTKADNITLHSLRHTYATRCIEAGMQAKVLQKLLGHKDIKITLNTYCDVFESFANDNLTLVEKYLVEQGIA